MDVEILPVGLDGLTATLDGWEQRAAEIERIYTVLADDFRATERHRFDVDGPDWPELAQSTLDERSRYGYGDLPMMQRTQTLFHSLTEANSEGSIFRHEIDGFTIGTEVPYAHFHQTGGAVDGRPPRRALVNLSVGDRVRWYAIIAAFLAHGDAGVAGVMVTSNAGPGL